MEAIFTRPSPHLLLSIPFLVLGIALVYLVLNEIVRYRARNRGFRGPPNRILVGNLPDITVNAPEVLRTWANTYGDVYQIQLGNIPILVVNSAAAAKELFSRHSHELSSRPVFYKFHKIVATTAGATIGTSPLSDTLKRRRRAAAAALNKPAVKNYVPYLDRETRVLVRAVSEACADGTAAIDPVPLIERFALSMALTVNWGTPSHDHRLLQEIIEVTLGISSTRERTQNLEDYIPLLRWIPFAAGIRQAKDWRVRRDAYLDLFDDNLKQEVAAGTQQPSIQANAMLDKEMKLSRADLRSISVSILQGGVGTIAGTVAWSVAFLAQRPDVQKAALADIRRVHGADALLCDASDEMQCTYVAALVQECLRYFTTLRLSLPREAIKDLWYEGRKIKRGTTIWLNAWACNVDPEVWQDPFEFRPERWIEQADAPLFTYGLGYRMCAGTSLANREMYLMLVRLISCFDILPASEVDVNPLTGSANVREGGRYPRPYKVYFKPRDEERLREAVAEREAEKRKK